MAHSADDGQTFAPEVAASPQPTGTCGCCGMGAFADRRGILFVLYRSATETVHRDMYLLYSNNHGATFRATDIAAWNIGACTMSLENLTAGPARRGRRWGTCTMRPSTVRRRDLDSNRDAW